MRIRGFEVPKRELEQAENALEVNLGATRAGSDGPQLLTEHARLVDFSEIRIDERKRGRRHLRELPDLEVLSELVRRRPQLARPVQVPGHALGDSQLHEADDAGRVLTVRSCVPDEPLEQLPRAVEIVEPPQPEAERRCQRLCRDPLGRQLFLESHCSLHQVAVEPVPEDGARADTHREGARQGFRISTLAEPLEERQRPVRVLERALGIGLHRRIADREMADGLHLHVG